VAISQRNDSKNSQKAGKNNEKHKGQTKTLGKQQEKIEKKKIELLKDALLFGCAVAVNSSG